MASVAMGDQPEEQQGLLGTLGDAENDSGRARSGGWGSRLAISCRCQSSAFSPCTVLHWPVCIMSCFSLQEAPEPHHLRRGQQRGAVDIPNWRGLHPGGRVNHHIRDHGAGKVSSGRFIICRDRFVVAVRLHILHMPIERCQWYRSPGSALPRRRHNVVGTPIMLVCPSSVLAVTRLSTRHWPCKPCHLIVLASDS